MRDHMIKHLATLILAIVLSGCSFLVDVILFNNSSSSIKVCSLNHSNQRCQIIEPKSSGKLLLVADRQINSWSYSIKTLAKDDIYNFAFEPYPAQASNIYCQGFFTRKCDIPLQYENGGQIYWVGKNQELPTKSFPNQPPGFPVAPDA